MIKAFASDLAARIDTLKSEGLFKQEQVIATPQQGNIRLEGGAACINLCANNYLGLSSHPQVIEEARKALLDYGFGMSSVRFICGTQLPHKRLERRLSEFLGTEDTILFPSCFDANAGLFDALLGPEDAVISDALNHASIIDGVRLCKAKRFRYANNDMMDLEVKLSEARGARYRLIVTDGVFSMDGHLAHLPKICELADRFDALVMVDDSHAVGFVGENGRGTPEHFDVTGRVDILTGTLGKALGGAAGGYVSARGEIVAWLRQRARPYLFSNTLAPVIAQTSVAVLDLLADSFELRERLWRNAKHFRTRMSALGFELLPGKHPIVPVMLRDPKVAQTLADGLRSKGVLVAAFSFPVVPLGQDRIRAQMSAAHNIGDLDGAIDAFAEVGRELGIIPPSRSRNFA